MDRGVRLALESGRPVAQVARDLGIGHEALRKRVRQAEADGGLRPDLPSSEEREESLPKEGPASRTPKYRPPLGRPKELIRTDRHAGAAGVLKNH